MAASIVQSGKASSTGSGTATLTTPSLTPSAIGDVFYVFAGHYGSSGLVPNVSDTNLNQYTFLGFNNINNSNVAVFACVLNSTTAMTISAAFGTPVPCDLIWAEASGLGSGGVGPQAVQAAGSGTSVGIPTVAATSGDLVFCAVYDQTHASTFTFPGAWTPMQTTANPNAESLSVAYQVTSGSGLVGGGSVTIGSSSGGLALYIQDFYFAVGSARVSQVAPEAVLTETANARVSQVSPESVLTESPNARISQISPEAVLTESPNAFVTQVGIELVMPYSPVVQRPVFTFVATT